MSIFQMKTLVLGMIRTNCYVISNGDTKETIIIDPADEAERIEQYLKVNDLVCIAILLTHGHFDHILAAKELAEYYKVKIYAHEAEAEILLDPELNASIQVSQECRVIADVLLKDQEVLQLAGFQIDVIYTPGHTAGGTCYYFHGLGVLISGDSLFRECIGRSDLPTGNGRLLVASILEKLMILEDTVKVYPGHGDPTTIGYERDNNIYLTNNLFDE